MKNRFVRALVLIVLALTTNLAFAAGDGLCWWVLRTD